MKTLVLSALLALALIATPGCYTFEHRVGHGGSGADTATDDAWFLLWGLVPLTVPDTQEMAEGSADYTVTTEFTLTDVVITFFTAFVSVTKQTVTVDM